MEDDDNIEQFTLGEEVITKTKKKKSKKCEPKRKYRIIIILLILLNLCIVIMLLYSKPKNDNNEYLDNNSLKFLLLSDIHDNETSLDLLIDKIKYKNYNYIFYLGDMV
jgi:hypothetical protein